MLATLKNIYNNICNSENKPAATLSRIAEIPPIYKSIK